MAYKKIRMERPYPYNGLDWMVALDEGLFEKEGLDVELVKHGGDKETDVTVTDWNKVSSTSGHAEAAERGGANIFNACEWGNYRRAQDSSVGARQLGRRAAVVCAAVIVPPWSDVYTPQQLAYKTIAVPFHAGTHYLSMQLLEGFVPNDQLKLVSSSGWPGTRYRSMMDGTVDACSVREPWSTIAEKAGCRTIVQGWYNGTDSGGEEIGPETYAAINRALNEAVRRINADKRKYLQYFIDFEQVPEVQELTVDDFTPSRIIFTEAGQPIPHWQLMNTYNWMVSRNLIDAGHTIEDLVSTGVMAPADD